MSRPSWDEMFLKILPILGERVSCNRGKCAAIFVKDNRIIATGYAGAPPGLPHCIEHGDQLEESVKFLQPDTPGESFTTVKYLNETIRTYVPAINPVIDVEGVRYEFNVEKGRYQTKPKVSCIRTIHAEINGIISAAKFGVSLEDSTLYVSMTCCSNCARAVIGVGVKRVVAAKRYHAGQEAEYLLASAGIPLDIIDDSVVEYSNQKGS